MSDIVERFDTGETQTVTAGTWADATDSPAAAAAAAARGGGRRRGGPAATAALAASATADIASSQADACDTHTRVCGGGVDAATGQVGRGRA